MNHCGRPECAGCGDKVQKIIDELWKRGHEMAWKENLDYLRESITTLLKAEYQRGALRQAEMDAESVAAERSRLLEEVGKLRRKVNGYEDVDPDAAFKHALDEVLKILSGEWV